jgi:hypothetical protein
LGSRALKSDDQDGNACNAAYGQIGGKGTVDQEDAVEEEGNKTQEIKGVRKGKCQSDQLKFEAL